MAEPTPHLTLVSPEGIAPRRRRRPGLAVLAVLAYAGAFGAGLWWMKARSPLFQRTSRVAPSRQPSIARSGSPEADRETGSQPEGRQGLASGKGLIGAAREEYLRRIATDCCACGCDLTLERCLATEKTCPESPARAAAILEELR